MFPPLRHPRTQLKPLLGFAAFGVLAAVLAGARVRGLLLTTASVCVPASLLAMALALPAALVIARGPTRLRWLLLVVAAGLSLLPPHVVAAGWNAVGTRTDWLFTPATVTQPSWFLFSGWRGAVLLHALAATPWAVLLCSVAFAGVDPRREELALTEGSAWRVLRRVTLPSASSGLAASAALVATLAATEIAITDLMRVRTFAEEVYTQASLGAFEGIDAWRTAGGWQLAAGVLVLASIVGWALWTIVSLAERAWNDADERIAAPRYLGKRLAVSTPAVLIVLVLAVTPIVALVAQVGRTTILAEGSPERSWSAAAAAGEFASAPWLHRRELVVSGVLAAATATTVVVISGCCVWFLRERRVVGRLAGCAVALLLATPGPLLGVLAIRLVNQPSDSWLAPLGWLYSSWALPWLVQSVKFLPIGAVLLVPLVRATPVDVVAAASLDGARPWGVLLRVVAPLHLHALAACWLVVLALSLGELSATVLVVPPGSPPIAVRLLSLLHYGVEERVAALSLWFFVAGGLLAAGAVRLSTRRTKPTQSWQNR